ncbi:MAG: hypothetical protein PSN04_01625 [Methyloprofundus sp.]|nr:hypothetical protein [Methyloprofundus sp.]
MMKFNKTKSLITSFIALTTFSSVHAGEVSILAAEFLKTNNNWRVNVTLKHGDTGWDHYANIWQITDVNGNVLASRLLQHPHVNEQPFTRALSGVSIPKGSTKLYIEAHDKVHGWAKNKLSIDLNKATEGYLKVEAK